MTKRSIISSLAIAVLLGSSAFGQDAYVKKQLDDLRSSDWRVRDVACQRLTALPRWQKDPAIREALVGTLVRENGIISSTAFRETAGEGRDGEYGEGYAEYVSSLAEPIAQFAAQPGEQRALDALVHAPYNPDSKFAEWLGERGDAAVASVLDLSRSDEEDSRAQALGVMGQLLRTDRKGAPVSPANRAPLKAVLLSGARDKSSEKSVIVRWNAVQSLGLAGDSRDIPLLQKIADSDPDVGPVARDALEAVRRRVSNTKR